MIMTNDSESSVKSNRTQLPAALPSALRQALPTRAHLDGAVTVTVTVKAYMTQMGKLVHFALHQSNTSDVADSRSKMNAYVLSSVGMWTYAFVACKQGCGHHVNVSESESQ